MVSTVEAVQRELMDHGFVLRYRTSDDGAVDGLQGREGAFLACSFWLVDCLHMIGRTDEAVEIFERLLALRNDLGLLAEEYDAYDGRMVGNFPQAFSHVSLINSAFRLSGADPLVPAGEAPPGLDNRVRHRAGHGAHEADGPRQREAAGRSAAVSGTHSHGGQRPPPRRRGAPRP